MGLKTEEIRTFLLNSAREDLAALYDEGMECQAMVIKSPQVVTGVTRSGHKWKGFTDGRETWKKGKFES